MSASDPEQSFHIVALFSPKRPLANHDSRQRHSVLFGLITSLNLAVNVETL